MKKSITVDFSNIVSELKVKELKLCFVEGLNVGKGIFIEDAQGDLFSIENYRQGSYLDKLIKHGAVVEFNHVHDSLSENIKDWQKEIWSISKVESFVTECV